MSTAEGELFVATSSRRLGIVLAPDGSEREAEGVLNPAVARDRDGALLLYPRMVAAGNVSRIGMARARESGGELVFERLGVVLEAERDYELRAGAHGCEDPRVTFIPRLDSYVMAYTAFGPLGPRIALAVSHDAYAWTRLGLVQFADDALNALPNKDAAFFPEPVYAPSGVLSFAMYHRPMLRSSAEGQTPIPVILALDPAEREVTSIAYMPVDAVVRDLANLVRAAESVPVLGVERRFGWLKNGAGTPPVRTSAGWVSIFHAVDAVPRNGEPALLYTAGLLVHDLARPDRVLYRSPSPVLGPATADERFGIVDDVVFPTGLDERGEGRYDVYYGAADAKIARASFEIRFR